MLFEEGINAGSAEETRNSPAGSARSVAQPRYLATPPPPDRDPPRLIRPLNAAEPSQHRQQKDDVWLSILILLLPTGSSAVLSTATSYFHSIGRLSLRSRVPRCTAQLIMSLSLSPHGSRAGPSPQLGAGLPRQSPSPQPDLDSNGGHTRSLSRSERLLAHLPTSFSEHLSRHASRSPDSIATSLAHVGLTLASPGSDYLTHRLSVSEINIGAQAFLTELNRVAINARTESQRTGLQRVNTSFVQGTIQVCSSHRCNRCRL